MHSAFESVQRKTAACKRMTKATSAQLMLQYPQPGSADQCVCTDGSCISNVLVCDGVRQCEGNDEGSFCQPIYRLLSQNPNARMENSPLLMDLAFWKRKCVTDTETAEVRKTKDLSAPLQEHLQKHPDVEKMSKRLTTENASIADLYVTVSGITEKVKTKQSSASPRKFPQLRTVTLTN